MHNETLHKVSVAPMMKWTDRHCRFFLRQFSHYLLLHTEMITTGAILHGNYKRLLRFDPEEQPVALQLGGSCPKDLSESARIGSDAGYCEINLNVGCPSSRVQEGRFGACLMKEPQLVGDCVNAMIEAVDIPITVKTRIGVDEQPEGPALEEFIDIVTQAGCKRFIIHARKAFLQGLSPRQNREAPPLNYPVVYEMKKRFSDIDIVINGGIADCDQGKMHLSHVDGIMFGRAAYQNCFMLNQVDHCFYGEDGPHRSRHEIAQAMIPYIARAIEEGTPLVAITKHMLGLFYGVPGARLWRRNLSVMARDPHASASLIEDTLTSMPNSDHRPCIQTKTVCTS
ncbi:MAG: tRNA dihydrouridine(20/20a) synthase DusA [Pseudomonadota bacterium]|nr:tRNA dihydrouridine(20/20a) synthase DusA [Pseudomonadota bacterium]